jgi:hypothetical protein
MLPPYLSQERTMHEKRFITKNLLQENSKLLGNKQNILGKYNVLFALAFVFLLASSIGEQASGATITFEIGGTLTEVYGPSGLMVGDPFIGTFSYFLGQTGTNVPIIGSGELTRYVFDSYSLTVQGQTISATGGDIGIYNIPGFDHFKLNDTSAGTVAGTINGIPASQLFLALTSLSGNVFTNTALPTTLNLADFPDLRRIDIAFSDGSNANGSAIGEITKVSVVPVPAAMWLFISGVGGLALFRVSRKKKSYS